MPWRNTVAMATTYRQAKVKPNTCCQCHNASNSVAADMPTYLSRWFKPGVAADGQPAVLYQPAKDHRWTVNAACQINGHYAIFNWTSGFKGVVLLPLLDGTTMGCSVDNTADMVDATYRFSPAAACITGILPFWRSHAWTRRLWHAKT